MKIEVVYGNIVAQPYVDAIVNSANANLRFGSGVAGAIHTAASGEHYALSQFSFAGNYAAKMPDNWEGYDLAVETGAGLLRVSVKTRSESVGWKASKWFNWDDRKDCDWFVFIFKAANGLLRSWVIPADLVEDHSNKPGTKRIDPWFRDLSWKNLTQPILAAYEDNWSMNTDIPVKDATNQTIQETLSC